MKPDLTLGRCCHLILIGPSIAAVLFGIAASASEEHAPVESGEDVPVELVGEDAPAELVDEDAPAELVDEDATGELVTVHVTVEGIMRLRKSGYVVATLGRSSDEKELGTRKVRVEFDQDCEIGQTCGEAVATFKKVPSGVEYNLLVCHKSVNEPSCKTAADGRLKDIGLRMDVIPTRNDSSFKVNVEDQY